MPIDPKIAQDRLEWPNAAKSTWTAPLGGFPRLEAGGPVARVVAKVVAKVVAEVVALGVVVVLAPLKDPERPYLRQAAMAQVGLLLGVKKGGLDGHVRAIRIEIPGSIQAR